MRAYIEIMAQFVMWRHELHPADLCFIGGFTRENISKWLDRRGPWKQMLRDAGPHFELGVYGWVDFHAVCGEIDIPWATEEGKDTAKSDLWTKWRA